MHHDNGINDIAEWNLLNDILNPSRNGKRKNCYYYVILYECINTLRGKEKFETFG